MTRVILCSLLAAGCMQGPGWSGDPSMMMMMGQRRERERPWPTVRIDEPAGALVVMDQGVFGEGIHATAPIEGQFQPTATSTRGGYPLSLLLDAAAAHRYGLNKPLTIYARLNVNQTTIKHGILVLAPSECSLRALVAGDMDEVTVHAEILPTAEEACRMHEHPTGPACPMDHGDAAHGDPHHAEAAHGAMHDDPHHGCGGCGDHGHGGHGGCGASHGTSGWQHLFSPPPPGATLTLRMTKF